MNVKTFVKNSLLPRWQLILFAILNLPTFLGLSLYGYIVYVAINNPDAGWDLFAYALILAILGPYMAVLTIISLPFIFWYLWKLGGRIII